MFSKTWQRLIRFRLRSLLLAMTVASVWLGFYVHATRTQEQAVKAIADYGGWVRYDFQFPKGDFSHKGFDPNARSWMPLWLMDHCGVDFFHDVVQVNLNYSEDSGKREENHNPTDEALQHLPAFPHLRVLLLSDTQARDASMRHLAQLKQLEYLLMWDASQVSDAGVAHLSGLQNLRYIHLSASQITDRSLAVFAKMPRLIGLSLQFNYFTDEGLKHVANMPQLERLHVCGRDRNRLSPITDEGLKHLANLKKLSVLSVQNTDVSPSGVAVFLTTHPGCQVVR